MSEKTPPMLKYPGGKNLLAEWIISFFPDHVAYCEPFAGSASVFFQKRRVKNEILNDKDPGIASVLSVMSDRKKATELIRRIKYTPYSEAVMIHAAESNPDNEMDLAWKYYCLSWMSRKYTLNQKTSFRVVVNNIGGGHAPAHTFARIRHLYVLAERLRGVQILCRDYRDVMSLCNRHDCLIYLDPPYLGSTRFDRKYYNEEILSYDGHREILEIANDSKAMIVLSGYDSDLYNSALNDWFRFEREVRDGSVKRNLKTEVLWINQAAYVENLLDAPR